MLELMARGGMRISEVLQLTPNDIEDRKLTLTSPKSGKEREIVFIQDSCPWENCAPRQEISCERLGIHLVRVHM
jgi:site-specific recombinase XerD